ncbi:MAG: anthranilate phosphoribosyltransferase [Rhodobiaceae bacterium]|nr:anthranilate phosphoribosyltransferase [Rhodobiaceae bacterium]
MLKTHIATIAAGTDLDAEAAADAFNIIMSGDATPSQIGGFLMGLRVKGETVDEVIGAVRVMRAKMVPVEAPDNAIDIVGTGGDAKGSLNISTCSALVAAGAGAVIAKHGNRALSSKSGAADVLMALGINIELKPEQISHCIRKAGIGFMFAPMHHPAMRNVGPTRVELGTRTIFNLLGPLSNPAGVRRQMVGVFSPDWVEPIAHVLKGLGCERAIVAHGDGMDEITTTGETLLADLKDGVVTTSTIKPEDFGLTRVPMEALVGGDAAANAEAIKAVLAGEKGPFRDVVLLNAAAALIVAGLADDFADGIAKAAAAIDDGRASKILDTLVAASNEPVA